MSSLFGKTVIITGAGSGIGKEAAVKIARLGAEVVIVARSPARGEPALAEIRSRSGSDKVSLACCDFGVQAQIRALASALLQKHPRIDVLVNNAGTVNEHRHLSEDGIEHTFAVNHLGYFLLTNLLLERMVASAPARIVNVSSVGHYQGDLDFDDLGYERGYSIMKAYRRSKLANVLFTRELARRLEGKGVTVNALHPGGVATEIWGKAPWYAQPLLAIAKLLMISPEQGGDRLVYLATSPEVEGKTGGYYHNDRLRAPSKLAEDPGLASKLWTVSEGLLKTPS
ncbi:MAG: SDR family oxidoreductase [Myxococcota bacterium]